MRLIDADELLAETWWVEIDGDDIDDVAEQTIKGCRTIVEDAPTIDPVKHGKWLPHPDGFREWDVCSCCAHGTQRRRYGMRPDNRVWVTEEIYDYCPHCGARMDGEWICDTPQTDCEMRYCEDCKHYDDVNGHCFFIGHCTYEPKEQTEAEHETD